MTREKISNYDTSLSDLSKEKFENLGFDIRNGKAVQKFTFTLVIDLHGGGMWLEESNNRDLLHELPIYESLLVAVKKKDKEKGQQRLNGVIKRNEEKDVEDREELL